MTHRWFVAAALLLAACGDGRGATTAPTTTRPRATTSTSVTTTTTTAPTTSLPTTAVAPVPKPAGPPATVTPTTEAPPVDEAPPPPPFGSSIAAVTADDLYASWRDGCPVGPEGLRLVSVTHWGFDGGVHTGRLVVHVDHAELIVAVFADLYAAGFEIERMEPVDAYGGSDDASMDANNTSAFNCRAVTGGSSWSEHSYGWAIDVNPIQNPYVRGSTVLPPAGQAYRDRSQPEQGKIRSGDAVVDAFAAHGWGWGGYWSSFKDYQHFSATGH